jgi:hypothetical protein
MGTWMLMRLRTMDTSLPALSESPPSVKKSCPSASTSHSSGSLSTSRKMPSTASWNSSCKPATTPVSPHIFSRYIRLRWVPPGCRTRVFGDPWWPSPAPRGELRCSARPWKDHAEAWARASRRSGRGSCSRGATPHRPPEASAPWPWPRAPHPPWPRSRRDCSHSRAHCTRHAPRRPRGTWPEQ